MTAQPNFTHSTNQSIDTYQVSMAGWWPTSAVHIRQLHEFLKIGHDALHTAKECRSILERLEVTNVRLVLAESAELIVQTKSGVEITTAADGLFVARIELPSIETAVNLLDSSLQNGWLPLLRLLFGNEVPQQAAWQAIKKYPAVIQVTTPHPELFGVDSRFGGIPSSTLSQKELSVQQTSTHIFVASTTEAGEQAEQLVEWYLFTAAVEQLQLQSLQNYQLVSRELNPIEARQRLSKSQAEQLQNKLLHFQAIANGSCYLLQQVIEGIDQRLSAINEVLSSKKMAVTPDAWQVQSQQTTNFLIEQWAGCDARLEQLQQFLADLSIQSQSFNISLQRMAIIFLGTAVSLSWLFSVVGGDISLSWVGALTVLVGVAGVVNLLVFAIYHSRDYRLSRIPKLKKRSTNSNKKA